MPPPPALAWRDGAVWILDQRKLPDIVEVIHCAEYRDVAEAIRTLAIRGAPALGVAAAYAVALGAAAARDATPAAFRAELDRIAAEVVATRPTAVNLAWAVERMRHVAEANSDRAPTEQATALLAEAHAVAADNAARHRRLAELGAALFQAGDRILHHCNTGPLATAAPHGTALGVIQAAHAKVGVSVWVDETRPLLQGARLTTWELDQWHVPYTLIVDSMAAHFMRRGEVDKVIVGADRIAANGDVANKIGTYGLAVLAYAHEIPFYVAAPASTIDFNTAAGDRIPIEQRAADEVRGFGSVRWAPAGAGVANPAFDVTPARLVTAIITEHGIVGPPYTDTLRELRQRTPVLT